VSATDRKRSCARNVPAAANTGHPCGTALSDPLPYCLHQLLCGLHHTHLHAHLQRPSLLVVVMSAVKLVQALCVCVCVCPCVCAGARVRCAPAVCNCASFEHTSILADHQGCSKCKLKKGALWLADDNVNRARDRSTQTRHTHNTRNNEAK